MTASKGAVFIYLRKNNLHALKIFVINKSKKEDIIMKKLPILLVLSSFMLTGCFSSLLPDSTSEDSSVGSEISINSENNYDDDINEDITTDEGGENEFDDIDIKDEDVSPSTDLDPTTGETIANAGEYLLQGEYSKVNITAAKNSVVTIFLDGVTINSTEGIAFGSSKAIELHLVLLNNSVNTITNDYLDTNAFHVKGDVYISGSGTLNITSKQKSALKVSKNLYIYEGVTINASGESHAITAQSITSSGATLNVTAKKDGLQAEVDSSTTEFTKDEGFVYLQNTSLTANTEGDCLQADTYVYISGGTYNLKSTGQFVPYSSSNMTTYGLESDDFKFIKSNGDYKRVAKDEIHSLSSSYYALAQSCKGVKAGVIEYTDSSDNEVEVTTGDYQIYVAHLATMTINTYDDCIHTNYGKTVLDSSNFDLTTYDDGAHADYTLTVNNANININKSYEGLEGANVIVNGENTSIDSISQDDGINAASDLVSTNDITINEGKVHVIASGDGLDANSNLYLKGGRVVVEGPGSGNGSLDAELIHFEGGEVLGLSTSGMTEHMSATQYTFLYRGTTSIAAGTKLSIVDENSNAIFSYTVNQSCNQVIFSHPDMQANKTYKVVSGTTVLASISMTSTLVTYGSSQGGGGPGGGGGGPHW